MSHVSLRPNAAEPSPVLEGLHQAAPAERSPKTPRPVGEKPINTSEHKELHAVWEKDVIVGHFTRRVCKAPALTPPCTHNTSNDASDRASAGRSSARSCASFFFCELAWEDPILYQWPHAAAYFAKATQVHVQRR